MLVEKSNVVYKKRPGRLALDGEVLKFTDKSSSGSILLSVSTKKMLALFTSKAGSPKTMLRIKIAGPDSTQDPEEHNFTFVGDAAISDRELFKGILAEIASRNQSTTSNTNGRRDQSPIEKGDGSVSVASARSTTPFPKDPPRPQSSKKRESTLSVKQQLLRKDSSLAALHRDLVISGQFTEEEFWDDPKRQAMLDAEYANLDQKKGSSSTPVDPRPRTTETGDVKISINAQMIHDIFEQYPIVAQAYQENVPDHLDERQFWQRYFQSKLFNQTRPGVTISDQKEDPIFDRYLSQDYKDDDIEPKHLKQTQVHRMLDLASQSVDHEETGNQPDITMRAGRNKAALPLIRHYNAHSQRLLDRSLGESDKSGEQEGAHDINEYYYGEIGLEELENDTEDGHILLEIQDQQRYFESQHAQAADIQEGESGIRQRKAVQNMVADSRRKLDQYKPALKDYNFDGKHGAANMLAILAAGGQKSRNKLKANRARGGSYGIPEDILLPMISCQAATNEFLRHFWMSSVPQKHTYSTTASPADRALRAKRMIGYLMKTESRVESALAPARARAEVDYNACRNSFEPMLRAVSRAIHFHRTGTL